MIRPFQIGDLFLVQRLGRQAARLNSVQSLIEPQSSFWFSLSSLLPWNHAKVVTYMLRRQGHGLLSDGLLQARKREGRAEVDVVYLAPALVSELGHPAIWEKLLAHYTQIAAQHKIERIYADVPDQPLPVTTFHRAGYNVYTRQTIWRLAAHRIEDSAHTLSAHIRPQRPGDRWALTRLYAQTVPKPVQLAEGAAGDARGHSPILADPYAGNSSVFVMEEETTRGKERLIVGALQIIEGRRGYWFQLWADTNNPNPYVMHELLRYGLRVLQRWGDNKVVYIGVHDYQGGLNAVLTDYGFAPATDRAKMVRHVAQWVHEVQGVMSRALESVPQIAIAQLELSPVTLPVTEPVTRPVASPTGLPDMLRSTLPDSCSMPQVLPAPGNPDSGALIGQWAATNWAGVRIDPKPVEPASGRAQAPVRARDHAGNYADERDMREPVIDGQREPESTAPELPTADMAASVQPVAKPVLPVRTSPGTCLLSVTSRDHKHRRIDNFPRNLLTCEPGRVRDTFGLRTPVAVPNQMS